MIAPPDPGPTIIPADAVMNLRRRLDALPSRHPDRKAMLESAANLYGISRATLYRQLRRLFQAPKAVRRADRGKPRKLPVDDLERFCEIIAALKVRTANKKGHHLSTVRAIQLMEEYGVETPDGLVKLPAGMLTKTTVNRYLLSWGYDEARMTRAPPAVRFQAKRSNECWQFDMSPSDLKEVKRPLWIDPKRGNPTLMLYSVVDDRSGAAYVEYRCVYGEDAESALRFFFNAMASKGEEGSPFQGIPEMIYTDNGPVTKSRVFHNVMECLGVRVVTHIPAGKDGRRTTARSKGKVERPFRTLKEAYETLYHFHEPENEAEANLWLHRYIDRDYNSRRHRSEPHSRLDDWMGNLPAEGVRAMCSWERYCAFAREPERRQVGPDARLTADGVIYEVDPDLAGETVILWWGLFDHELYVEHGEKRYGPFSPTGGPIPLHKYRKLQKTKTEERADRVEALANRLGLPRAALSGESGFAAAIGPVPIEQPVPIAIPSVPFQDPDPFKELRYSSALAAKLGISDYLAMPLARLTDEDRAYIDAILAETLDRRTIIERVRERFLKPRKKPTTEDYDHAE
jgi:hypothetical protein